MNVLMKSSAIRWVSKIEICSINTTLLPLHGLFCHDLVDRCLPSIYLVTFLLTTLICVNFRTSSSNECLFLLCLKQRIMCHDYSIFKKKKKCGESESRKYWVDGVWNQKHAGPCTEGHWFNESNLLIKLKQWSNVLMYRISCFC